MALLAGIMVVAEQQTRLFDEAQKRLAIDSVKSQQTALLRTAIDYGTWEDVGIRVVQHAIYDWADEHVGHSIHRTFGIDAVFILMPDGRTVYGYRDGERVSLPLERAVGLGLTPLVSEARSLPVGEAVAGNVAYENGAALAAMTPVEMVGQTRDQPLPLLIFVQRLDGKLLESLSRIYSLPGLRLNPNAPTIATTVPVRTFDGATLSHMEWTGSALGMGLIEVALPIWVILALACSVGGYLMRGRIDAASKLLSIGEWRVRHDALTGLPNRVHLAERLEQACDLLAQGGQGFAVFYLDLDGFKAVNDTHGHDAGDQVLCAVAQRIRAHLDPSDLGARLGGDEFAVLLLPAPLPSFVESRATALMNAISRPIRLDSGVEVAIGATIGVSLAPQDASSPEDLLHGADKALYEGKRAGKRRISFAHRLGSRETAA
ncbi:diguanylate cyclase domain-containing protein [Aureimonas ureilytica]|uniref:diguanylate cyclase domain-containing protein n=1 Tax=Aureimonas ureilytica TaxID=401562 RepID=UPI003CF2B21B